MCPSRRSQRLVLGPQTLARWVRRLVRLAGPIVVRQLVLFRSIEPGQFRARDFRRELADAGLVGSMGRVASADNAAMESFFSLLQKNVLGRQRWDTRDDLRIAIIDWTERTYNRRRRQRRLGRLTPVEFEVGLHNDRLQAA